MLTRRNEKIRSKEEFRDISRCDQKSFSLKTKRNIYKCAFREKSRYNGMQNTF